jgi:hypothetical protein
MTGSLRLAHLLNGKMSVTCGYSRRNQPGLKPEHTEANVENALGRLAVAELAKRMAPPPITTESSTGQTHRTE